MADGSVFGDYVAEDAWDADDSIEDKLTNLERRAEQMEQTRGSPSRLERLAVAVHDLDRLDVRGGPLMDRWLMLQRRFRALR